MGKVELDRSAVVEGIQGDNKEQVDEIRQLTERHEEAPRQHRVD